MVTHQELYDSLLPLMAELISTGVLDRESLAKSYENFASVAEQEGKPAELLLALSRQLRQNKS